MSYRGACWRATKPYYESGGQEFESLRARHLYGMLSQLRPSVARECGEHEGWCALNRQPLEVGREVVQPARAIVGDDDGLGEHAAGFAVSPLRIEQVDVHGKHHAGAEFVPDRLEGAHVGALGVVAVAGIFERGEPV